MARIRLTNKTRIANDPSDMEGVRQDCGKKTRYEKYTNFDPAKDDVGGRGNANTDGSKLHATDVSLRDDMHVLKLKQAKMWQRSKLATKLAMYLLGEKAPQSMIKAQAAEFLSLGNAKLAKAVSRWAKTEYLYADDQEKEEAPAEEAPEKDQEKEEAPAEEAPEKDQEKEEAPAEDQKVEEESEDQEEAPAEEKTEQAEDDCENCKEEEACGDVCAEAEDTPQQVVEEAQDTDDDEISDAALASLFESNSNTLVANKNKKAKSGKVGVQKFDQPQRVASNKVSLDQLWEGAPDLSDIF